MVQVRMVLFQMLQQFLGVILGIHINHDDLELAVYLVQDERQVAAQLMTLVMRYDHNAESRQL